VPNIRFSGDRQHCSAAQLSGHSSIRDRGARRRAHPCQHRGFAMTAYATLLHALAGYIVLLVTIRFLTRRPGSQLTLFEFVFIFLMGGIIIASTMGKDRSVTNATCAVIMVGFLH